MPSKFIKRTLLLLLWFGALLADKAEVRPYYLAAWAEEETSSKTLSECKSQARANAMRHEWLLLSAAGGGHCAGLWVELATGGVAVC